MDVVRDIGGTWVQARHRLMAGMWPALQQTVAASLAWIIAIAITGHSAPIFAPITTLVALNADRGGRGSNAVRFVLGVIVGVIIAGWAMDLLGENYRALAAAILFSLLAALLIGGNRIVMAQAGVSAIIAVANGQQAGEYRVIDTLVGGAVALVFSQLLFPAHPLALLRRAESAILRELGQALDLTARAMDAERPETIQLLRNSLRSSYSRLSELSQARNNATAAAARTPLWRFQRDAITQECESAAQLDLLGNSCLTVTRTAPLLEPGARTALAPAIETLAETLVALAGHLGEQAARQRAADRAAELARHYGSPDAGWAPMQMLLFDVLLFAGISTPDAERIVRRETATAQVTAPPALRRPFHNFSG